MACMPLCGQYGAEYCDAVLCSVIVLASVFCNIAQFKFNTFLYVLMLHNLYVLMFLVLPEWCVNVITYGTCELKSF